MLGNKKVLAELALIKEQLDRIESKLDARAKLKSEAPKPEQFMGDNGLYSYKNWEEKMKDKYLKRHN